MKKDPLPGIVLDLVGWNVWEHAKYYMGTDYEAKMSWRNEEEKNIIIFCVCFKGLSPPFWQLWNTESTLWKKLNKRDNKRW